VAAKKVFFLFPGQVSQYRGMGSDLAAEFPAVRSLYERAGDVLGYDLAELSFADPRNELGFTRFTQPALLTHGIACLTALEALTAGRVQPFLMGGHSLGEYTALVAAGALDFASALELVAERGRLMGELGRGGMLATTLDRETAAALAGKHFCGVAGCNLPDQTVIAGDAADLDAFAAELAAQQPPKRAVKLNTEGAFHTYLMVAAAEQFRAVLAATPFEPPRVDVLANYSGRRHEPTPQAMRSALFFQLFNPVLWVDCMTAAIDGGADAFVELGGGIGKGEGPAEKRPNLESIVKKSLKWREHQAEYLPAINAAGIRATAERLIGD
jgi:[acyl-carrier-protein] S-malonyltransferase